MARTIVVTGGSSGIGAAIARAFSRLDDRVAILARETHGPLPGGERGALFIRCDVRRPSDLARAMHKVAEWGGGIDVLVNSAGMSAWRSLAEIDEDFWDQVVATNLKSVLFACQAAAPYLRSGGSIVNISSLAGKRGSANNAAYCATKFGVDGITQALAKELGPRGVRVNAVCPVYVDTPGLRAALAAPAAPPRGGDIDVYLAGFAATQSALGRLPDADEVASACVFLASASSSAITGQCVNVDCGVFPQ